jgi:hypothetical protein
MNTFFAPATLQHLNRFRHRPWRLQPVTIQYVTLQLAGRILCFFEDFRGLGRDMYHPSDLNFPE